MNLLCKRLLATLCGASMLAVSLTGCMEVSDKKSTEKDDPDQSQSDSATVDNVTTGTSSSTTTTPSNPNHSANTDVKVDMSDEKRSPNVTYFVEKTSPVDVSYFNDVVFVGDSVSLKLTNYHYSTDALGNAEFLTSGSLGVANAMWDINREDAVHPSLNGSKVTVVDGIAQSGRNKVYWMLGINDLGLYGVDATFENFKTITAQVLEKAPNVKFYVQSCTPMMNDVYGGLTNEKLNQYNALLSEYCREQGWYFVDVASVLRDDNGRLLRDYCSDPDGMALHFTDAGCEKWVEYLFSHTA